MFAGGGNRLGLICKVPGEKGKVGWLEPEYVASRWLRMQSEPGRSVLLAPGREVPRQYLLAMVPPSPAPGG